MNRLLDTACIITRSDQDLARESNKLDQQTIIWNAIALLTISLIAMIGWSAFFGSFLSAWAAIPLGLLVATIIFQLDQAMGASDWELAGVLREESHNRQYWLRLLFRGGVAFLLAQATAVGVCLWLFGDAITTQLQAQRLEQNAEVEKIYEGFKSDVKARVVTPVEEELKAARDTRSQVQRSIASAQSAIDEAQQAAKQARMEAGREADGLNRPRGEGPKWHEAKRQEVEANRTAKNTQERLQSDRAQLTAIDAQVAQLGQLLETRNKEFQEQVRLLDDQKLRDSRWVPERNDPLMRFLALRDIEDDATYGSGARYFNRGAQFVLLTFELAFLLIKIIFAPASAYTVRLIARTKAEAASIANAYARDVEQIRRRPRGNLRVVGGHDEPDPDTNHPNREGDQR